jgi:XRE family aerobic/anaerobic benzoate catabolism transcriptional regulator
MTRKQLARDSGVSERYLALIEGGRGNISVLVLRQLAKALNLPLDALL